MVSPPGQDPSRPDYLSTPTIPTTDTPDTLPASQYPYINQYYANMHNPNAMQALSPYSTTYSTTTSASASDTPPLYDRYRDSGMMNRLGPILLSLICPKYQDLPSKSNPLSAIRLYVKSFLVAYRIIEVRRDCTAPY